jgi:asparagine synthase (glutamine-hydrolysing)
VLVHLYEDFGPEMVSRLHGMFAFAIWDSRNESLLMARDRTGMKPLSYLASAEGLVFCSELRSLWALDPGRLRVAPSAVMQYLAFGYVPDPASIFEGVTKLPPGHLLLWSARKGAQVRRCWTPPHPEGPAVAETEMVEMLRAKLDSAVASHLEAEVPLGAFLSGGLDSSTVVALMNRHASGRVRTFSIGFAEEKFDESAAARAVAAELGTNHSELVLRPNVEDTFEAIALMFDEPFADSSAIATFLVAQLARQSVTVALSGDGGDEIFGGYTRSSGTRQAMEAACANCCLRWASCCRTFSPDEIGWLISGARGGVGSPRRSSSQCGSTKAGSQAPTSPEEPRILRTYCTTAFPRSWAMISPQP